MSTFTVQVDKDNFETEVLGSELPVVIDFWAPWCGPCIMLGPVLDELAEEYQGRVKVAKVNVDEEPELAGAFRVSGIPTMYVMADGKPIGSMVGFGGKSRLQALFDQLSSGELQAERAGAAS